LETKAKRLDVLACSFRSCSTGKRALAAQTTTFPLTHATPDSEFLTVTQRVLQTVFADHATPTYFFGFFGACTPLWEKQIRVNTQAVGVIPPTAFFRLTTAIIYKRHLYPP
jgi:hypothetical protein